ncbi:MAG: methyltransferase domain-containing protein [Chloroflexi bacterium]|nr:MAG: methyltransferase domain-containing protein [Chloroflexota bacterium]
MTDSKDTLKEKVRQRYAAIADQFTGQRETAPVELVDSRPPEPATCCQPAGDAILIQAADGMTCCSPADSTAATLAEALYALEELDGLPDTVTAAALGCGNPTAIAGLQPGEVVLDLGSGGGIDCFLAAKAVGPTGCVIGVDMTDSMLALANQNRDRLGLTNVEFRKGEIENLPVESSSVDVIISNCVINLSPDKDAVFREAFRVLKPGGRFCVSDMVTEGEFPPQLRANVNAWAGCITGALDQAEYLDKMRRAGFVDIRVESRVSYGLENLDQLDPATREALTRDLDWSTVPDDVRLYSARIVARKPEDGI